MSKVADGIKGVAIVGMVPAGIGACLTGVGIPAGLAILGGAAALYRLGDSVEQEYREAKGFREELPTRVQPPPLPASFLFRPQAPLLAAPPRTSPEYVRLWYAEARRFFRVPRNRWILAEMRPQFRNAMLNVEELTRYRNREWNPAQQLHPAQLLSQTRGYMVREGHLG